jgi:hypothetical protein
VELTGIWDPRNASKNHLGLSVWTLWDELLTYDICLLTSTENASERCAEILLRNHSARVLVPQILGFGKSKL